MNPCGLLNEASSTYCSHFYSLLKKRYMYIKTIFPTNANNNNIVNYQAVPCTWISLKVIDMLLLFTSCWLTIPNNNT